MKSTPAYRAPSVGRALKILELVSESSQGLGISELARRLNISKGTVFGLCGQLERGGALLRDPASKRYGLGPLVATLASRSFVYARLRDAAGPEMTRLRDKLRESVFLGVMTRGEVIVVDARQPTGRIGVAAGPGTRLPITAGAVGRVLLAGLPPAQSRKLLARADQDHPAALDQQELYLAGLQEVRRQGYALERDEYLRGLWAAAVPLGSAGGLSSVLWVVGFTSALKAGQMEKTAQTLVEAGQRITRSLGEFSRSGAA